MLRFFLLSLFLASFSLASEVILATPSSALQSYYNAVNDGDMKSLKQVMLEESYDKDVQIYALSIAFADKEFHQQLKQYSTSEDSKQIVTLAVEKKLKKRKRKEITVDKELSLGHNRMMVSFKEDSKQKQLYLSYHKEGWKIDYLAGRKTE